ncbi:crossover junction endodeoxyribonuclease RuvC [Alphaproteobacteria bacterium]|nr:crossover junction endodeoxyribonuclease RuvC [Alphaproteobacteria bacterium]GHS96132.1 crossover junction endodeoxyribonuclease RuvC [Alphaproteobacteria bacterium]
MEVQSDSCRILGLDPGLRFTGWGCVEGQGGAFVYKGHGVIPVPPLFSMAERLGYLFKQLQEILKQSEPSEVALEEVFINKNGESTMKLCMARGVVMLVPATLGIPVFEYGANAAKKTITGRGHAEKAQVKAMVEFLLPPFKTAQTERLAKEDCSDALAVALCHAQNRKFAKIVAAG